MTRVLPILVLLLLVAAAPAGAAKINKSARFLQVYDNNVENLETAKETCAGDWKALVRIAKRRTLAPDVFLVQQVSGAKQLKAYTDYLTKQLPGSYRGVIAQARPRTMRSPCGAAKSRETNAIVYRPGRLVPFGKKKTWRADSKHPKGCRDSPQDRVVGVRQVFFDRVARKGVAVGSIHWPTAQSGGAPCTAENARETAKVLNAPSANLRIVGGDANTRPSGAWYARMDGDLGGSYGFRDAVWGVCADRPACTADQWTIGGPGNHRRIDFLWARLGPGGLPRIGAAGTVSFGAAGERTAYSDHRAIRA